MTMGTKTGIAWTDSTWNPWIGCTKVGPGCDFCYAESYDKRAPVSHWGPGVPRRRTAETNQNLPHRWNRLADAFQAKHGHPQRVFTLSLGDWADNEVPKPWRWLMWNTIRDTPRLRYQLCTKRVSNIGKMLPPDWSPEKYGHVGFLVTCVNQEEADRDISRLRGLKAECGFRWIGISYEPALGPINFRPHLAPAHDFGLADLDWIICGGESGSHARDDDPNWYRVTRDQCALYDTAFFMKQMAHLAPIPADLQIQEFPEALCR